MNKVYRTVFNKKTNTWVAVAETAKAHGKSASGSVHGIAVGLLERVGIKIPRFAASTMLLVLTAAGYAHAGPGIYINDGQDLNCTVLPDSFHAVPYAIQPGSPQQVSTPLRGVGNVSMYNAADVGLTSSYNPCNSRTTASSEAHDKQTNRTLFYGDKNHTASETENGAKNLTLGGRLDVNSGIIGLGDRGTNGTNATNSIRIGTGVTLDDANKQTNSIAIGVDTKATVLRSVSIGAGAEASDTHGEGQVTAIGYSAKATYAHATALGAFSNAATDGSVAVGFMSKSEGVGSVAMGKGSVSGSSGVDYTTAVGFHSQAGGYGAIAVGSGAQATVQDAAAFGHDSRATLENSVALGNGSTTAVNAQGEESATIGSVTYGGGANKFAGSTNIAAGDQVSIGSAGNERQIKHVAAGAITASSTDAINGSQLFYVTQGLQNQIGSLGFGVNADNNSLKTHQLGKELAIVAGNTTETTSTSNLKTNVTQDAATGKTTVTVSMKDAPTFASVTTQDAAGNKTVTNAGGVTITPVSGNPVRLTKDGLNNGDNKITGVAAGDLNANSKDAVNGSQLFATNQNVATNAANIAKGINFGGTSGSNKYALGDTINVKGDSNIISETVAGGAQLKLADVLNVGQAAPVKINGNKGEVSGLSNTTLGGSDFAKGKRAATEEQLNAAQDQLVNVLGGNAANNGGNISMTDIGGTGENNIHDAIKAVNATANLPLTFGGDSGKDVERKPGTKLNIVGGQTDAAKLSDGNIGVVANGSDKLEVKLAKDLAVDSVKAGDTTVNTDGVKVGDVNLTKAGLNNGGNKITNVAAGTDDTDAVNVAQLNKAAAAAKTEVIQGDNIVVTQDVGANGQTIYKVATDKNLKVDSVTAGDTVMNNDGVKVGDDVALNKDGLKAGDVNLTKAGLNNGGNKITNVAAGTDDTDAVNVSQLKQAAAASKTEVVQGKNIVVTEKTGDKGQTVYEVATDKDLAVDSVKAGDTTVNNDGVKVGDNVALNKDGLKAGKVNLTKDGLDNAGNKVTNVADGDLNADSKDAVNGSQLYATNQNVANNAATIAKGINFGGTTGSNNYALGSTINVKGDSNIISETVAGGAQLKLADEISVKTVNADTFKAGNTVMNNDGVKVGDKVALNKDGLTAGNTVVNNDGVTIAAPTENNPNNQVKLSPVGLNNGGQRITNVAPGKDGTDAANVNQLIGLGTELQNNINQVGKKAYAGVASAIAQGSIPQVTRPGATGIGVGSGYYGGQSAMAIGVSAMSDGGNWIVKGNFSANTGGHVGVGVGALYQW